MNLFCEFVLKYGSNKFLFQSLVFRSNYWSKSLAIDRKTNKRIKPASFLHLYLYLLGTYYLFMPNNAFIFTYIPILQDFSAWDFIV